MTLPCTVATSHTYTLTWEPWRVTGPHTAERHLLDEEGSPWRCLDVCYQPPRWAAYVNGRVVGYRRSRRAAMALAEEVGNGVR